MITILKSSFIKSTFFLLLAVMFSSLPADAAVYTYDALNRLTSVKYDNGQKITYDYDPGGNLLYVEHSSDNTPPVVIKTDPADGSNDISVSASVYVTFSEIVVEDENFTDIYIKSIFDNSMVNYVHNINSDTLTIDPVNNFANSVTYAVYLPAGAVKDTEGNSLENDCVFSFTTVEPVSGFTVTSPNGGESWQAGAVK